MRRRWGIVLALAAGAVVFASGGYVVGAQVHSPSEPSCSGPRRTAADLMDEWSKLGTEDTVRTIKTRAAAIVVKENPGCFSPSARAQAAAAWEQLGQSGNSVPMQLGAGVAVCAATGTSVCTTSPR